MNEQSVEVGQKQIRQVMKEDFNLSFVRTKKLNLQANSDMALIKRQQYALKMLDLLSDGKRIINIDESWLNETSFIRKTWA